MKNQLGKEESKFFEMWNSVVYRKKGDRLIFYVSADMKKIILFKYHDEPRHMGLEKVYEIVSKTYWFPKLRKKIGMHIQNCFRCIAYNLVRGKSEGDISCIPKGEKSFDIVQTDYITVSDTKVPEKNHILVVIDSFTKFVKLYPTKSMTSREANDKLNVYFSYYSKPRVII